MQRPIAVYADAAVLARIRERFGYAFLPAEPDKGWWRPALEAVAIDGPFAIGPLSIMPFEQHHGRLPSWGFRVGGFAYSTDVNGLPEAALAALAGVEVWLVDCLRERPHPSHAHLAQTLAWIAAIRPRRARPDPHEPRARLPGSAPAACRRASSRPTTAWCSICPTADAGPRPSRWPAWLGPVGLRAGQPGRGPDLAALQQQAEAQDDAPEEVERDDVVGLLEAVLADREHPACR